MKTRLLYIFIAIICSAGATAQQHLVLSLDYCRTMTDSNSTSVCNAILDVEAAKAQRGEALAEYFPKVSASAFGFYSLNPMIEIGIKDILGESEFTNNLQTIIDKIGPELGINTVYRTMQRGAVASVSLMQPLFAGGRIVAGNRLASLGLEAATLKRDIATRTAHEQVDKDFWQIVALQEKEKTLEALSIMLDTIQRDVTSAYEAGIASNTDLMQVELHRSELEVGRIQLTNGLRLAKMNLLNGMKADYSYIPRPDSDVPYIDSISLDGTLDHLQAPDIYYVDEETIAVTQEETRLLSLAVEAQQLQRRMALGEALPQVAVGANYGYSYMLDKGKWNGAVYAVVQVPISDWGKKARNLQRLDRQIQKAENDQEYLSEQILLQIRQLWLNANASWQQMLVTRQSLDLAQANADQSIAYYRAGMIPLSELLQAQTTLTQANEAYIKQAINYITDLNAYLYRTK